MDKKVYIAPSLKATEMDEELLAGMSAGGDVNISGETNPTTGEPVVDDGDDAAARKSYSVWDE
jgi:hypothetical protein